MESHKECSFCNEFIETKRSLDFVPAEKHRRNFATDFKFWNSNISAKLTAGTDDYLKISRRITSQEYRKVVNHAEKLELTNLDIQGHGWLRR